MAVQYVNTSPAALLETHPRAVYRATLQRSGLASLGVVDWPAAVRDTLEKAGESGFGIALGGPLPGASDRTAVIELRTKTAPASGDSVGDLASAIENASRSTELVRLERLPPVPAAGSADAAARAATREAEVTRSDQEAARTSLGARLAGFGRGLSWTVGLGLAAGVVILAIIYLPRPRGGGGITPGDGKVWE